MSPAFLMTMVAVVLLADAWWTHRALAKVLERTAAANLPPTYPPLTVIRPIRGLDTQAEENIEAALDNGYPGEVETIFVFDDEHEPALPLVKRAIEAHREQGTPGRARIIFSGEPPLGRTGKLNAMIAGLRQAETELVAFADSDIRPDRQALGFLVARLLESPKAGSIFAPVVAASPIRTLGDAGYAVMINGLYGPEAMRLAYERGGALPFIMGQFMVCRRQAIEAIGGLECADGQLVDDMFLGQQMNVAGYDNLVSFRSVPIIQQGMSFGGFVSLSQRWIMFSRSGLPTWSFKARSYLKATEFWLGVALAGIAAASHQWLIVGVALAASITIGASINRLHRAFGGAPLALRHAWVSCGILLASPLLMLSVLLRRGVTWRGRTYELNAEARLACEDVTSPGQSLLENSKDGATSKPDLAFSRET